MKNLRQLASVAGLVFLSFFGNAQTVDSVLVDSTILAHEIVYGLTNTSSQTKILDYIIIQDVLLRVEGTIEIKAGGYKEVSKEATNAHQHSFKIELYQSTAEDRSTQLEYTPSDRSHRDTNEFSIYPNPSEGFFQFQILGAPNSVSEISVYNSLGQVVITRKVKNGNYYLDIRHMPPGVYYLKTKNKLKQSIHKLIVQ